MNEEFWEDLPIAENDTHYMEDPVSAKQTRTIFGHRDPTLSKKQFPWGVIPGRVDPCGIRKLVVDHEDQSVDSLPEVIGQLTDLLWLDIPRRFVSRLKPGSLPPKLHTLRISDGGSAAIPKALVLNGLVRLLNDRNGMLKFTASQVPDVRFLSIKLDPGGSLLREVTRMSDVFALEACPISTRDVLQALVKLPLRYLKASRGHLDTIEPIRDCPSLTNVWLEDLDAADLPPAAGRPPRPPRADGDLLQPPPTRSIDPPHAGAPQALLLRLQGHRPDRHPAGGRSPWPRSLRRLRHELTPGV